MLRKLTLKQNNFTQKYLETGNATEAAMEAYTPQNRATASVIGHENLRKPKIRATIQEALESEGLTNEHLAKKIAELVNAQKRLTIVKNGQVEAISERIDTPSVKAGLEFALKLRGTSPEPNLAIRWISDEDKELAERALSELLD